MNISNQNLDLDPVGENIDIHVTYNASFTSFERHLAGQGLRYREEIIVLENDAGEILLPPEGVAPLPRTLASFPIQFLPVTDGNSVQVIPRNRTFRVLRERLNEDPVGLNPDEIRCRIRIRAIGFPGVISRLTDTEVLEIE